MNVLLTPSTPRKVIGFLNEHGELRGRYQDDPEGLYGCFFLYGGEWIPEDSLDDDMTEDF